MKQLVRNVKILGTGSYVPETIITNESLELVTDTNAEWIYNNLGIRERRIADVDVTTSDLAFEAGKRAIESSGLSQFDIELIIVATATPDYSAPSTACIVQDKLNAPLAVAFDINAVCSGFLYAMSVASQFIASGVYDNVLVIGADTFSKITDWSKRDCVFFGDGAGAVVMTHCNDSGFLSFNLKSDGSGWKNFVIPSGGERFFKMNGKEVYNTAVKVLPQVIEEILIKNELTIDDIDMMIPHQPSIRILKDTANIIGLPFEKVMTNMDKYANTSAGTIPILLDEVIRSGKVKKGDTILFAAVGSGWTYGSAIIKWI